MLTEQVLKPLGPAFTMSDSGCDLPCQREWDEATGFFEAGWWCVNDHTGCIYNDGHNSCCHEGKSTSPLGGWK